MIHHSSINPNKLFIASKIALIATAMTFAIRANLIGTLGVEFSISPEKMGVVFGTAFWGFTISIIIGGSLCSLLGFQRLLQISFFAHLLGIILTIYSYDFWSLFGSTLLIGIANGFVEAACNPLVANLYPHEKTKRLNQFHVWFPGGIVIGGLIAYFLNKFQINWQMQTLTIIVPSLLYGFLFFNEKFPDFKNSESKTNNLTMLKECISPLFILISFCMLLTAGTELGTNQWIAELLGNTGVPSILLLVFINGLMAIGRSFAGPIEKKLSPPGMLLFSAIFTTIGLYLLSSLSGYTLFAAAAIFAIGICFFCPTMLGFVSEYLPNTGAIGLSIVGGAGMLSVAIILPVIGMIYDHHGGSLTLRYVAGLPALLTVIFGILYLLKSSYAYKNK